MGGFGGQQAKPPTLDTAQSQKLTRKDYELKEEFTPRLTETTGKSGREEYARSTIFALQGFTNPSSIYQGEIEDLRQGRTKSQKSLSAMDAWQKSGDKRYDPTAKRWITSDEYAAQRAGLQKKIDGSTSQIRQLRKSNPVSDLQKAFGDEFEMRDDLLGDMQRAERSTNEYERLQQKLQKGLKSQQVDQRSAKTAMAQAAQMGSVNDVTARQVGAGALGNTLMSQAMERAQSQGQLSAEASRDAVQAARAGMASRGMATGSAGMAAELLNRDSYSRARMAEDLAFAQGVQGQDLQRQFNNAGNRMQADLANQQTAFNTRQFNAANRQQANMANAQASNNMRQFNTQLGASIDQFNAAQRTDAQRYNVGLLQTSQQLADQEAVRKLGLGQSAYNFALQTNPKLMLAGLGSPYANFTPEALRLMSGTNVQPIYSGGQLGSPGWGQQLMSMTGQVAQGAGMATQAYYSDKRMKKDIKQVGKDGVLGLKTYEYRYKGEGKDTPKHVGFMAQEVQKVLPQAVEEFDYKGKKRLAIKPAVIGQALTDAIAQQQKNMFADGYVVGAGLGD